jgi:NADPH-dependent 2,4-dienoyl-CoA reductase/sulfur reductase-like enzyme
MKRRDFIKYSAVTAALLHTTPSVSQSKFECQYNTDNDLYDIRTNIAVCGGGYAGLSIAKYLKELNPNLDVTVIEQKPNFISCPYSNLYLGGIENVRYEDLNFDYFSAVNQYKYAFINEKITQIDRAKKWVYTAKSKIQYDYMIMACGIDYDYSPLFGNDLKKAKEALQKTPAGLRPGSEHLALKRMIKGFTKGNFVITVPPSSYRCPPAPYERACMIAHYFKTHNIDGKVVILDPRKKPAAKASKFLEAFETYYANIIEYHPLSDVKDVDFENKVIEIEQFDKTALAYTKLQIPYEEASVMPANKANALLNMAKLETYDNGWAKLKQPTFRSVSDDDVYVIGDAQGEYPYPKSAFMANSCAFVAASEIVARYANTLFDYKKSLPGNICYSMITSNKAVSVTHSYEYAGKIKVSSQLSDINKQTASNTKVWYENFTKDIFGL